MSDSVPVTKMNCRCLGTRQTTLNIDVLGIHICQIQNTRHSVFSLFLEKDRARPSYPHKQAWHVCYCVPSADTPLRMYLFLTVLETWGAGGLGEGSPQKLENLKFPTPRP